MYITYFAFEEPKKKSRGCIDTSTFWKIADVRRHCIAAIC